MPKQASSVFSVDVTGLEGAVDQPHLRANLRADPGRHYRSARLAPNARLPSGRMLAKDFGSRVARNTVDEALSQLVADGYVMRRRGAGTFVVARLPERDAAPFAERARRYRKRVVTQRRPSRRASDLESYPGHYRSLAAIPFTPSLPPINLFPRKGLEPPSESRGRPAGVTTTGLMVPATACRHCARPLQRTRRLCGQLAARRTRSSSLPARSRRSSWPARFLLIRLTRPGSRTPGYQPAQHCLRAAGLQVNVPVPVDEQGLDVGRGRILAPRARLAYVTPAHQFPMGYEMSLQRRRELLGWALESDGVRPRG